jgi:Tol biopolymer transport system component
MTLAPGTRLGPYEIQSPLGAGGMGEVYKARDTRLDRTVAIKVLPEPVASDPELKQRFEREAKTLAALSHPHICPVFDVGSQDGIDYLVMERLEGETLAQRLSRGALPLDQALQVAIQIADALDKAHRKGIVHRDLKPGNIMLTKVGAKLLDFGLAKLRPTTTAGGITLSGAPTASSPLTGAGSILGTFQYMAPEQLEGQEADARTDIFAFGALVFEMVTGKKAFEGKSQASLIAAIITSDPAPMSSVQPVSPPALDRVIKKCLSKEPDRRWQTTSDLEDELEWVAERLRQPASTVESTATFARARRRERQVWAVAVVLLIGGLIGQRMLPPASTEARATRLTVVPGGELSLGYGLSPDGRRLAYSAVPLEGGPPLLWVRELDTGTDRQLPGTEGASLPFWAPDGASIGFFAQNAVKRTNADGGAVQVLCDAPPRPRGGTWSQGGVILFAGWSGPLQRVPATGGAPSIVGPGDGTRVWPSFLPDGRRYLYRRRDETERGIYVASLDGVDQERRLLDVLPTSRAEYAEPGYVLYTDQSGILVAQRVDPDTLAPDGEATPVSSARIASPLTWSSFAVRGETLLFQEQGESGEQSSYLQWFDRQGRPDGFSIRADGVTPYTLEVAPDGQRAAVSAGGNVWIYDAAGNATRVTPSAAIENFPLWAPDGRRIVFRSFQRGASDVFLKDLGDTSDGMVLVAADAGDWQPTDWSQDGALLLLTRMEANRPSMDIWVYSLATGEAEAAVQTRFNEYEGQLSPDNRWLAYTSDETGLPNVYVRPFPGPGPARRVSTEGGQVPRWRGDGQELYYLGPDRSVWAATVSAGTTPPTRLFQVPMRTSVQGGSMRYDTASDGQRFLVIVSPGRESLSAILNWRTILEAAID